MGGAGTGFNFKFAMQVTESEDAESKVPDSGREWQEEPRIWNHGGLEFEISSTASHYPGDHSLSSFSGPQPLILENGCMCVCMYKLNKINIYLHIQQGVMELEIIFVKGLVC